jgi:CubicO group peptidase (beta-lactamase class C family)
VPHGVRSEENAISLRATQVTGTKEGAVQQNNRAGLGFRALVFTVCCAALQPAAAAGSTSWPTTDWQTSTPEEQGMSSNALADLVDFGAVNAMDSLLVVRRGRIVVEAHYAPFQPGLKHVVNSVTKAVVGTLAGIAFKEGALGPLDQSVIDLFPERKMANVDANKKAMTLSTLLDSTSGLDWREPLSNAPPETLRQMEQSRDWVGFILDRPMARAPGLAFDYDSGTWHLLSAILAKKTGASSLDYAKQKLFTPLGINDISWRNDPQGITIGGYGLFMRPRDMAKIGYLYLRAGEWAGQQLLPASWVDKVNHASVDMRLGTTPNFRYANGWWAIADKRAYMAVGFLRQLIIVLPDADMVAVVTGRWHYPLVPLIDRLTGAAKSDSALPADTVASARLAARIHDVATEKPTEVSPASPMAGTISGKSYRFGMNAFGLKSIRLDLVAPTPAYEALFDRSRAGLPDLRVGGPLGLDGYFRVNDAEAGLLRAAKGRWLSDTSFQIVSRSILEGIETTAYLAFEGDQVVVDIQDNRGVRGRVEGEAKN